MSLYPEQRFTDKADEKKEWGTVLTKLAKAIDVIDQGKKTDYDISLKSNDDMAKILKCKREQILEKNKIIISNFAEKFNEKVAECANDNVDDFDIVAGTNNKTVVEYLYKKIAEAGYSINYEHLTDEYVFRVRILTEKRDEYGK